MLKKDVYGCGALLVLMSCGFFIDQVEEADVLGSLSIIIVMWESVAMTMKS